MVKWSFARDLSWEASEYIRVPLSARVAPLSEGQVVWRIALVSLDRSFTIIGLEVCGDVVIGRRTAKSTPDLDLTAYDGGGTSVSRIHAMLRPSDKGVEISDLGSTNGTRNNGVLMKKRKAIRLKDKDIITFGNLQFQVRIVEKRQ